MTPWGAAMAWRTSWIIALIGSAYIGGAVAFHLCWPHSLLLAIVAAPFGGSFAATLAALLLFLTNRGPEISPLASQASVPSEVVGHTR